jgi:hypothetical protein
MPQSAHYFSDQAAANAIPLITPQLYHVANAHPLSLERFANTPPATLAAKEGCTFTIAEALWLVNAKRKYHSQLFTLRLWTEPGVLHPGAIRFRVQHLPSGEVRYFGDWPALIVYLASIIRHDEDHPHHANNPE